MDWMQALRGAPTQAHRLLRLRTPLGEDVLVAERLDGWEAVDHGGFRFELTALSSEAHLDLDSLVGAPVLLELLTADSLTDLRPFHGHVLAVAREGSNGGLARYRLTIEPWLALLRERRDSYAFHAATVIDIVEQIFDYYKKGVVVPAWRWELADRSVYVKRSLTSQYQETDFDFVARLLAEEGIFYWFEHQGDPTGKALGAHTLVLADSAQAFKPGEAADVRYHRANSTEQTDTVQQWEPERRWQTGAVRRASWDYRTLSLRPAGADTSDPAAPAVDDDTAGPYAWANAQQGQYRAQQHLDARQVAARLIEGAGSWRRMAPGRCLVLTQHPTQSADPLVCLNVHHHAQNNLGADVQGAIEASLGAAMVPGGLGAMALSGATGRDPATASAAIPAPAGAQSGARRATDFYTNTFAVMLASRSYRPHTRDGHGLRRQPRPTVSGAQSAIITGNGDPLHTERDHRVIVQQHWQRGDNAASLQSHPRNADAPADASAGTWARVLTPMAGANWGSNQLPRVGQEVWLNYLEGDVDRPVIVAGVYNGQGNTDAPYNQQAGGPANATGDAAAWFTGNGHAGVLSGMKSQDLPTSQSGTGGYRQLQFDDTPDQGHAQLATTDAETALTLGHLKHLDNNARQSDLGYGVELTTLAQGALRGGAGLLLASARGADQMDASAAASVLGQGTQLAEGLTDVAQQQGAKLPDEPAPAKLNAVKAQTDLATELAATQTGGAAGMGVGGGEGTATAWTKPHLVAHGEDGLVAVTPRHQVWVSGTDSVLTANQDLNWIAQGQWSAIAAKGIALYVQGGKPAGSRPVTSTGIAMAAASGVASVHAQQDQADFAAEKAVTLSSSDTNINVEAKQHVLLTAAGAYLKLQGSDIEIGAPGNAYFKGAKRELTGGQSGNTRPITLVKAKAEACEYAAGSADASGAATMGAG